MSPLIKAAFKMMEDQNHKEDDDAVFFQPLRIRNIKVLGNKRTQ